MPARGWKVDAEIQPDNTIHVWPIGDLIEHDLDDICPCGTDLEEQVSGVVLVSHNSLDGRELSE